MTRTRDPLGTGNLCSRALGNPPAALPMRWQERFHACLHAFRHAWKLAGDSSGPVAGSGESLRGLWSDGKELLAGTITVRLLILNPFKLSASSPGT
eukprot:4309889-Pyramimonas_sp.AAC.1